MLVLLVVMAVAAEVSANTTINQPCSDPNAERVECASYCQSTCAKPDPGDCILICKENECVCKKGFILSEKGGKCIPVDQCPSIKDEPCNGDSNAVIKAHPIPCPSTCASPNAQSLCKKYAPEVGCECKPGYLKSTDDKDCPPVNCTRPNEVWSRCPSACLRENCADVNNQPTTCNTLVLNCQPQCICKKGYFRNESDICIPAKQCPNNKLCSDPNAERVECAPAPQCRPTCAAPNPGPCIRSCALNECVCKKGFVLSEKGGKCIPVGQCPIKNSCNGDPNAIIKECPLPCPATCDAPNAMPCKKQCDPIGCECKEGFILSQTKGQCVRPEKCKGGNPCGANETFVPCKVNCPSDYCPVNEIPNRVICETPSPCYPGCVCKINYRRRSIKDSRCMKASECPKPIQCKANEVYNPCRIICPPQTCASIYSDYDCRNATKCEPGCDCIQEYLRNGTEKDLCIPSSQCPGPTPVCGLNEHYEINRSKCDITCKNKDREALIGPCKETSGCFCDDGYYRNTKGICVSKKQCPPPRCNENETYSSCGTACPETCMNRGGNCTACTDQCVEGCFCSKGFVRADDGSCVRPKDCPPPTCRDPNEIFDKCPSTCPPGDSCSNLWSKFDCSKFVKCCKPQCRCKLGYLRKDGKCVPTKQCTQTDDANEET